MRNMNGKIYNWGFSISGGYKIGVRERKKLSDGSRKCGGYEREMVVEDSGKKYSVECV
jgi:hypothetical protein